MRSDPATPAQAPQAPAAPAGGAPAPDGDVAAPAGDAPAMRYLWITWTDPHPERDGQRMYSGRLIHAVAAAGGRIDVLCFASEAANADAASPRPDGARVRWHTVARAPRPSWLSPVSRLPNVAFRCATPPMRGALARLLGEERWDAVVLDGLAAGWAMPALESRPAQRRPRLVHVSHNHEASTRAAVAATCRRNPVVRRALTRDAAKAGRLESRMVAASDLVTAITEADAARFAARHPDAAIVTMPPGYAGARVRHRVIGGDLPRRAIVVGSFHWIAKQLNLEAFLAAADPLFAAAGAEIQVIGDGDPGFLESLRRRCRATELVGPVADVTAYMRSARLAVVPERAGGGFKLKVLDYVFHRTPILAIAGSLAGTPLHAPESARLADGFEDMARQAVDLLDSPAELDRLQNAAYDACRDGFDWSQRGARFLAETAAL